jgi:ubiquinone/menaquinone biosynthesis C-methylase UbiE
MALQTDPEGTETKYLRRFADLGDSEGKRVLEVGCGDGRLTWRYAASAGLVTGIDTDADDLRVATIDCPSDLQERVTFARADSVHLPFAKETFDLAIFAWSF